MQINLNSGTVRAILVFVLVGTLLWMIFYLFENLTGLAFFGQPILILIGSGWAAYWTWKKTEVGRY